MAFGNLSPCPSYILCMSLLLNDPCAVSAPFIVFSVKAVLVSDNKCLNNKAIAH